MAAKGHSATRNGDLVTGDPLWLADHGLVAGRPAPDTITTDIAVVGAGISGALMARELAADHQVVVLDRRGPAEGSTSGSTALIQWEIDLPLTALAKRMGWERACRAYLRSARAVGDLVQVVRDENIPCDWAERRSLYLAGNAYGCRVLKREADARTAIGLPSKFKTGPELRDQFGIIGTGAILSDGSAVADPVRLTRGLLKAAEQRGAQVYWPIDVREVASDADRVTLTTDGPIVRAKRAVFCTGYEFPQGLAIPDGKVVSTWALATKPRQALPDWMADTLIWEASDPYLYARTTPDGRLIIGGEDDPSPNAHADPGRLKRQCEIIAGKFARLVPGVFPEVDYCWAGAFGESTDGLPQIAPDPSHRHVWSVIGFGGNGITYSVIASQIVAAALRGERDPDADLYTP